MKEFVDVFKKTFDFSGRSRRKEFWLFVLFTTLISIALSFVDAIAGLELAEDFGVLGGLFSLIIIIPSISVTVRRLHDIGRSGWWLLLTFVPIIGWITLFIFNLLDSQSGTNAYGSNPKDSYSNFATAK